ncbi:MAG: GldG family protein [Deltaproteobacteria bacterium]|nr:GldG family protein [Deltaproteobacteria bacterium]MBK9644601.1 GldG family protein [Deltaproteobacteria bacterium]
MDLRKNLRLNSGVQLVAVVVICVLLNILAVQHFSRLDLTQDRVHTLSQAGRALMGRLERPLIVKVWFTKGLEAPYNNHEQLVVDKLQELRAWSRGRMEIVVIDPTNDSDLQEEAQRYGVLPNDYAFRTESRTELKKVWMGVAFLYGERQATLPAVTNLSALEYDLTRTIKSLLDGERKLVGYTTGHQEPDLLTAKGPLENLRAKLSEAYELRAVDLTAREAPPEGLDALLIVGPQGVYGALEQYRLDQLIMDGVPVAFFLTNYKPDLNTMRAVPVLHGLEALLGNYGVELNRDLVADRVSNGKMRFPVRQGSYLVYTPINLPLIPNVSDLSQDSVVVRGLGTMQFPFVSSIDLPEPTADGVKVEVLARASSQAGRIKNVQRIDPDAYKRRDTSEEIGAWPLIVSLQGTFKSFHAGRDIPDAVGPEEAAGRANESVPTRVVVGGSADFIANNIPFMVNLVDWMVQDEELISIRSKTVQVPMMRPLEPRERDTLKAVNLLGGTVFLLLFGVLRRISRRRA